MNIPKKATALVLAGAVGLASAAYGIGSAAGGGSATAESNNAQTIRHELRVGPPPGFDDVADKLGVDEDELADAMRDFHEQERDERREDLASALAKALGSSADRVEQALDEIMEVHKVRFEERLADELRVDASEVSAALEELRDERPDRPSDFAEALAGKLGVETTKVEDALDTLRPRPGARPPGDHRGAPLRKLASALDVSRAELREALREVRAGAQSGWEQHEERLAAFLADRFGLDTGEVTEALADLPHPRIGPGPGGPGGPPGPVGPGFGPGRP